MRDATGRTGTHHITYELALPDGRVLCTGARISHPPNRPTYGAGLWAHTLHDQLDTDEATFWAAVREGLLPQRSAPSQLTNSLPTELALLLHKPRRAGPPRNRRHVQGRSSRPVQPLLDRRRVVCRV